MRHQRGRMPHGPRATHPSRNCYTRHGCRCEACVELNRGAQTVYREMRRGDPAPRVHGIHPSLTCYNHHGCRCDGCRVLNSDYESSRWAARAAADRRRPLSDEDCMRLRRAVGLA